MIGSLFGVSTASPTLPCFYGQPAKSLRSYNISDPEVERYYYGGSKTIAFATTSTRMCRLACMWSVLITCMWSVLTS